MRALGCFVLASLVFLAGLACVSSPVPDVVSPDKSVRAMSYIDPSNYGQCRTAPWSGGNTYCVGAPNTGEYKSLIRVRMDTEVRDETEANLGGYPATLVGAVMEFVFQNGYEDAVFMYISPYNEMENIGAPYGGMWWHATIERETGGVQALYIHIVSESDISQAIDDMIQTSTEGNVSGECNPL